MRLAWTAALAALLSVFFSLAAAAQTTPSAAPTHAVTVQPLASVTPLPTPAFDPVKATNAYLAQVSGKARAKSDAYFEGSAEWLPVVDTIYALIVAALLLWLRISARIRDYAVGMTRSRFWQVPIYILAYVVLTTLVTFPLTVYEDFIREHAYGLSNQNFVQWFGDFAIGFGVNLAAFMIVGTVIYAIIRRVKDMWWLWASIATVGFLLVANVVYPVFIAPLFNTYYPLPDSPLKQQILSLARSEGIPVTNVYEYNASKQSKRISANVSGAFGTTRISLTDNLINRSNGREVKAVLGHEMGHYVLDHNMIGATWDGLVFLVGFAFAAWGFRRLTNVFGGNWDVRAIDDPAGLPVLMGLAAIFFLFATPVTNTITRTIEQQADMFGINAAREPDGFAQAALQLSEYRKLDPSPWEEFIFYDHPSGRTRIWTVMRWKAEHINDPDIKAGPVSPQ
ncbi:MAG TPA: M48 family metallopeptidase [Rhizomicrobium sp.]|jgi:STE24 endopeptidase|nr:M48 family metallopeptidase [Rhizomicrobium sp.]